VIVIIIVILITSIIMIFLGTYLLTKDFGKSSQPVYPISPVSGSVSPPLILAPNMPLAPFAPIDPNQHLTNQLISNGNNTMQQGQSLVNHHYKLLIENDGNLVLRDASNSSGSTIVWSTGTANQGSGPYSLTLQTNGNLCLFDGTGTSLWCTQTSHQGIGPWRAVLQADRNFCIYDSQNSSQWCTNTQA